MSKRQKLKSVFKILSVSATLVCLGLWAISYWNIVAMFVRPLYGISARLSRGYLQIEYNVYSAGGPRIPFEFIGAAGFETLETQWCLPFAHNGGPPGFPEITAWIPVNLFGLLLLGLTTYLLLPRHRARSRRKLGLCTRCGYNLTGNTSGRCPECGEHA